MFRQPLKIWGTKRTTLRWGTLIGPARYLCSYEDLASETPHSNTLPTLQPTSKSSEENKQNKGRGAGQTYDTLLDESRPRSTPTTHQKTEQGLLYGFTDVALPPVFSTVQPGLTAEEKVLVFLSENMLNPPHCMLGYKDNG